MQTSFEGNATASFTINKDDLLRAIDQHPERFSGKKGEPLRAYVNTKSEKIDLTIIFEDYRNRMAKFNTWLCEKLAADTLVALRDYDHCVQEKKNNGTRMWWNMLLGNWLRNWEKPPNPHDHLHKYLTPEQLSEVYMLPRNSKAQVDLVIRYLDTDQAIDEELRKQAYELFERSPPFENKTT